MSSLTQSLLSVAKSWRTVWQVNVTNTEGLIICDSSCYKNQVTPYIFPRLSRLKERPNNDEYNTTEKFDLFCANQFIDMF